MSIFAPDRALMYLRKTHPILKSVLNGVDQTRATTNRDGEGGWNVLEIVCHLNDYEQIFQDRLRQMIHHDRPSFTPYNPDALVAEHHYEAQSFEQVLNSLYSRRAAHLKLLEGLEPDGWTRVGLHPMWGEITILDHAMNTALHDVNHLEQIVRVLGAGNFAVG